MQTLGRLARSPIVRALAAFVTAYVVAILMLPASIVHDIQDCLAMTCGVTVVISYGPAVWRGLLMRRPKVEDFIIVGIGCVAAGYGSLRVLRLVWIELGRPGWLLDSPMFGLATMIMLFGALCHLVVRGSVHGKVTRRGIWPIVFALGSGALLAAVLVTHTRAAEHHRHHAFYQNWINKLDKGCCNNQDCGELAEENERVAAGGVEVRIEGEWCAVQPFHYLKRGNAPDWSTAHVCVAKHMPDGTPACQRLLCYQPKPGI
jgi:hypothetical protein